MLPGRWTIHVKLCCALSEIFNDAAVVYHSILLAQCQSTVVLYSSNLPFHGDGRIHLKITLPALSFPACLWNAFSGPAFVRSLYDES